VVAMDCAGNGFVGWQTDQKTNDVQVATFAGVVQRSETIPVSNRVGINLLLIDKVHDDIHMIPTASGVQWTRFSIGDRCCI
jgi:hypothetical protein